MAHANIFETNTAVAPVGAAFADSVYPAGAETVTGAGAVLLTKMPAFTGADDISITYDGSVVYPTAEFAAKSAAM